MQFYNTMSRKKETFTPVRKGLVGVYACGITAYALSHIGHARSAVAFDILVRLLRYKGYEVTFVRNFTPTTRAFPAPKSRKPTSRPTMRTWTASA